MTPSVDRPIGASGVTNPATSANNLRRKIDRAARALSSAGETQYVIKIPASGKSLRQVERELLVLTMKLTDFNCSAAARVLCISRPTLYRKLSEHGIRRPTDD